MVSHVVHLFWLEGKNTTDLFRFADAACSHWIMKFNHIVHFKQNNKQKN